MPAATVSSCLANRSTEFQTAQRQKNKKDASPLFAGRRVEARGRAGGTARSAAGEASGRAEVAREARGRKLAREAGRRAWRGVTAGHHQIAVAGTSHTTTASEGSGRRAAWEARETWRRGTTTNAGSRALGFVSPRFEESGGGKRYGNRAGSHSQVGGRSTTAGGPSDAGASTEGRGNATRGGTSKTGAGIGGGRRLDGDGNDLGAADDGEAEGSLLFVLDDLRVGAGSTRLGLSALHAAELFGVGENEVHVLPATSAAFGVGICWVNIPCQTQASGPSSGGHH